MAAERGKVLTPETVNPRMTSIKTTVFREMNKRALAIEQEGVDKPFQEITACNFGDPHAMGVKPITYIRQVAAICAYPELLNSASMPEDVKQRARRILQEVDGGTIGSYNLPYWFVNLPEKVARFIERRDGGIPAYPSNIIISIGASASILSVINMVVEEGPKRTGVMTSVPQYTVYEDAIMQTNAVKVEYQLDEKNGWALNVSEIRRSLHEARKHCNPKLLCIVNPGNPTGQVQSRNCIEDVIKMAADENLLLLADEVYQDNVFAAGSQFHSFKKVLFEMGPQYSDNVQLISLHSISKGIAGECAHRCGYLEYVNIDHKVMNSLYMSAYFGHPPILGMIMMDLMLDPPMPGDPSYNTSMAEKQRVLNILAENAQLTEEILNQAPGIHCNPLQGAMYAFPRIDIPDKAVKTAQAQGQDPDLFFCIKLLEETGIILVPGTIFGQAQGTFHVRITLLLPVEKMRRVISTITDFHKRFLQEYS